MKLTQRTVTIGLFCVLISSSFVLGVYFWWLATKPTLTTIVLVSFVVDSLLLVAYWYNWQPARFVLLAYVSLSAGLFIDPNDYPPIILAFVPAVGVILARPRWVVLATLFTYVILLVRGGLSGMYADPINIIIIVSNITIIVLGRVITETALQAATESAERAATERKRAEQQATALELANQQQDARIAEQQSLLDLVTTLETPTVTLADGVLFAPVVAHLDQRRASLLTTRLLDAVYRQRTRLLILDISGVAAVDIVVAKALRDTTLALRLLGCQVTISGISADVALTLTSQDMLLTGIQTVRTPQDALSRGGPRGGPLG